LVVLGSWLLEPVAGKLFRFLHQLECRNYNKQSVL
jgi:hypothetical protein